MKICPQCTTGYHDTQASCPTHGTPLSEIRDLKPGMIVHKTYRIIRKLGHGGMGAVYLAEHILMGEPRALKFLSAELSADELFTSRFLREVRTLRQVRNAHVVTCGDLESAEDDSLFFAMEFVDGPDLGTFLRRTTQPIDVPLALSFARSISDGLGAAHAKGIVHRDIKPENILMTREEESWVLKIADFGIVATRELNAYTRTGSLLLTPYYAAPEQWRGMRASELDCRTDIYALGGVLYQLLTGQRAFEAQDYHGWAQQHLAGTPQAPSRIRCDLADWKGLDALVLSMLAKDREDRPKNVAELQSRLDNIVHVPRLTAGDVPGDRQPRSDLRKSWIHAPNWVLAAFGVGVVIAALMIPRFFRPSPQTQKGQGSTQTTKPVAKALGVDTSATPSGSVVSIHSPREVAGRAVATRPKPDTRAAGPNPELRIKKELAPAEPKPSNLLEQGLKSPEGPKPLQAPQATESNPSPTRAPVSIEDSKPHTRETSIYEIEAKARSLFDSGEYSNAKPLFEQACAGGSGEACDYLGLIFTKGAGVRIDNSKAALFYELACNAGEGTGCSELGYRYLNGIGVPIDYTRAVNLSRKGCDSGSIVGCENLGLLYARGDGVPKDDQQADALWAKACDKGVSRGCGHLGQMYLQGRGVPRNIQKARDLLGKGCSLGDQRACELLKTAH
jgi:eukaryotic-like serine/threonine-protein kinase